MARFQTAREYTTLGEACARDGGDIQTGPFGSQLHASDYVPSGIPSIMPQNIGDNRVHTKGIARITKQDAERLSRYRVRPWDIVYSRRGDVEKRALIQPAEDGWLCGTGCLRVRFGVGQISPIYASYYLGDPRVREWIVRHAHGATMPNLNTEILSELPFVIPPPDEQKVIAKILGTLDDKIELSRRMNETLEDTARALFKSWFVDFDPVRAKVKVATPDSPSLSCRPLPRFACGIRLGKIPATWGVKKLGDLIELAYGKALKEENRGARQSHVTAPMVKSVRHERSWPSGPGVIVGRNRNSGRSRRGLQPIFSRLTPLSSRSYKESARASTS